MIVPHHLVAQRTKFFVQMVPVFLRDKTAKIRCEANTCTDSLDKCSSSTKRCPEGYTLCGNGECKASGYLCDQFECPKNKPYMCPEGVCVHDETLCDIKENGCPYNKPNKCPDGTCVLDEAKCNKNFTCNNGQKLCPDGSCVSSEDECPLKNGCYKDRPFKCADGTCINTKSSSCSPVLCPPNLPIKCPYGNCVDNSADCSNDLFESDSECEKGFLMCADGRCVESTDYCRPVFTCESSYQKCYDGTCRVTKDLCPQSVQCPEARPYRCDDDICVKSSELARMMIYLIYVQMVNVLIISRVAKKQQIMTYAKKEKCFVLREDAWKIIMKY